MGGESWQNEARWIHEEVETGDTQIVSVLKEAEAGQPVKEICRKYGISSACYYQWKSKSGGLSVSELK